MAEKFIVILVSGEISEIDSNSMSIDSITAQLRKQKAFGVKIGNRIYNKNNVVCVMYSDCGKNNEFHNILMEIAQQPVRVTVDDYTATMDKLYTDLDTQDWVSVNGDVVFNKHAFSFAIENEPLTTETQ